MDKLDDIFSQWRGKFRAFFRSADLGELALPPEIRTDYSVIKVPVSAGNNYPGQVESLPQLSGSVNLKLKSPGAGLELLSGEIFQRGELKLLPEMSRFGKTIIFPAAKLLPRWEFEPSFAGEHILTLHFELNQSESGKLFLMT